LHLGQAAARQAALLGAVSFERLLENRGARTLHGEAFDGAAGPCFLWVVDAEAEPVKELAIGLEEGYSLGRLWDFDVYGPGGSKLDREAFGKGPRACFVCGSPAAACAGRRVHELADVERRFAEMLDRGIEEIERKGEFS
jgi:holo-ACP synthase